MITIRELLEIRGKELQLGAEDLTTLLDNYAKYECEGFTTIEYQRFCNCSKENMMAIQEGNMLLPNLVSPYTNAILIETSIKNTIVFYIYQPNSNFAFRLYYFPNLLYLFNDFHIYKQVSGTLTKVENFEELLPEDTIICVSKYYIGNDKLYIHYNI